MFNPLNEFPHTIELGSREVVGEYPREQERFKSEKTIQGFMDTPTSSEQLIRQKPIYAVQPANN